MSALECMQSMYIAYAVQVYNDVAVALQKFAYAALLSTLNALWTVQFRRIFRYFGYFSATASLFGHIWSISSCIYLLSLMQFQRLFDAISISHNSLSVSIVFPKFHFDSLFSSLHALTLFEFSLNFISFYAVYPWHSLMIPAMVLFGVK